MGVYQASAAAQGATPQEVLQKGLSGVEAGTAVGLGAEALAPAAGAAGMRLGPRRPAAEELLLVFFVGSPCLGEEGAGFLDVFGAVQLMILSGGEEEVEGVSARPGSPSS